MERRRGSRPPCHSGNVHQIQIWHAQHGHPCVRSMRTRETRDTKNKLCALKQCEPLKAGAMLAQGNNANVLPVVFWRMLDDVADVVISLWNFRCMIFTITSTCDMVYIIHHCRCIRHVTPNLDATRMSWKYSVVSCVVSFQGRRLPSTPTAYALITLAVSGCRTSTRSSACTGYSMAAK